MIDLLFQRNKLTILYDVFIVFVCDGLTLTKFLQKYKNLDNFQVSEFSFNIYTHYLNLLLH